MIFSVIEEDQYGGKEHGIFHMESIPRIGETIRMDVYRFIVVDVVYELDYPEIKVYVKKK